MDQPIVHIRIEGGSEADAEDLECLASELLMELRDIDEVEAAPGEAREAAPEESKGPAVDWGSVAVKILSAGGLGSLVTALANFLNRDRDRSVTLEINGNKLQVSNLSKADAQELVRWFQLQTGMSLTTGK